MSFVIVASVGLGLAAAGGVTKSIMGAKQRKEARAEKEAEKAELDKLKQEFLALDTSNPFADMENVFEDLTVDQRQAQFQKEQAQQSAADIMANLKGAAGGSGVAGLAQVLANQGQKAAQQSSADIGRQEQANQARARAEAGRLQQLDVEGEQKRDLLEREGGRMVEQFDLDKQDKMLDLAMQRASAANQYVDEHEQMQDKFVAGAVSGIMGGVSDIRLKENINKIGVSNSGIPIYTFSYKNDNKVWSGTMAQDLIKMGKKDAVVTMDNGYYAVRYDMIDVDMKLKKQ